MKKILSILFLLTVGGLFAQKIFAATPSPSAIPTKDQSQIDQQINNLKERIASRVAQLNLVDKKGVIGIVSDISETQLSLTDTAGNTQLVDVDELTKFSSPSAKSSFGISDITKGSTIGVIGLYNKDSRRLLARWVDVLSEPKILSGGILTLDKTNYTFTIATLDSDSTLIDVEDITKTATYTKDLGITKTGFSKLTVGERVQIIGYPDKKNPGMIVASRILAFPDLPVNPKIVMVKPGDIAPVTPSTGSGKKLTPITH